MIFYSSIIFSPKKLNLKILLLVFFPGFKESKSKLLWMKEVIENEKVS